MGNVFVGIDGGSTTVKLAVADESGELVYEGPYVRHLGKVAGSIKQSLDEICGKFPNVEDISFTGYNTLRLAKALRANHFLDSVAQKTGVLKLHPNAGAVVSFGGQGSSLMLFRDGQEVDTVLNSVCAAGTCSFFEMQANRTYESQLENVKDPAKKLDKALRLAIEEGLQSQEPSDIAARCVVLAESDMIHKGNAQIPKPDIFAGLARGLVNTYASDFLQRKTIPKGEQLFIGGGSLNALILKYLRGFFPTLYVPEHATSIQAYGAALLGMKSEKHRVFPVSGLESIVADTIERAPKLVISESSLPENTALDEGQFSEAFLGIDIGSNSTKYALVAYDENGGAHIIDKRYIKTEGAPIVAVNKLLTSVEKTIKEKCGGKLKIAGVGTTGSGRMVAGYFVGADEIVNEITAHGIAAVWHDPKVDSVVDIGGQDAKLIQIVNGHPVDYAMNNVCAAGTGSFLEKLASGFGIDVKGTFQDMAMAAEHPVVLGERCTAFMYSAVISALSAGATLGDIFAGLAISIILNYKNRVVKNRKIGKNVVFLGGTSLNKAVVAALEWATGSAIKVPPHSEVGGAVGAAMYARDKMMESGRTESAFRGFGIINEKLSRNDLKCKACENLCTLDQYYMPMRGGNGTVKVIFGGVCGKYETGPPGVAKARDYSLDNLALFEEMVQVSPRNGANQRKVILPRHLYMHQHGVFYSHFFGGLGFQPVLDRETTREMIELGTQSTPNSFCFSKIVSNGHIASALRSLDDNTFLFLPTVINVYSPNKDEPGLYCPWAAASYFTAKAAFSIDGKVLSPVIHLKERPDVIADRMRSELESKLGVNRKQIQRALENGLEHQHEYERRLTGIWEKAKEEIGDGPAMVVVGRPYLLYDKRLNLGIFPEIAKLGVPVMPMGILPFSGIDISEYDNMYWKSGADILRAAKFIFSDPRLFMVCVTNFGCGPDSFILKPVDIEMRGKPSTVIEVDANTARAGMVTRLEAHRDVVMSYRRNLGTLKVT